MLHRERIKENPSPFLRRKENKKRTLYMLLGIVSCFDIVNKEREGGKKEKRKKNSFRIFDVLITVHVFREELGQNCAVKSGKYMRTNSAETKQRGPLLYRSISCGGNV